MLWFAMDQAAGAMLLLRDSWTVTQGVVAFSVAYRYGIGSPNQGAMAGRLRPCCSRSSQSNRMPGLRLCQRVGACLRWAQAYFSTTGRTLRIGTRVRAWACASQYQSFHDNFAVSRLSGAVQVILQARRIGDEVLGVVDDAPKRLAIRMLAIVLDVDDELVANPFRVASIANDFGFDD